MLGLTTPAVRERAAEEKKDGAAVVLTRDGETTWCGIGRGLVRAVAGLWAEEARREDSSLDIIVAPSASLWARVRR